MKVRTKSVVIRREMWYGDDEFRLAYVREPERDEKGRAVVGENGGWLFDNKSELRWRMLLRYLRERRVVDVPQALIQDVQSGFADYADERNDLFVMTVRARTTGTCYDLGSAEGRLRQLEAYLKGYEALRLYDKRRQFISAFAQRLEQQLPAQKAQA